MNYIESLDGLTRLQIQDDGNVVVYHLEGVVWVPQWASGTVKAPAPPPPPPSDHPDPIHGTLTVMRSLDDAAHFHDHEGELLPVGATWFGALEQRRSDPDAYSRTLRAMTAAGYQFTRVLFAVGGGDGYWNGHEVAPHAFTATDGHHVVGWSDYDDQVKGLGREFAEAGLQVFVSCGGLQSVMGGDLSLTRDWARRVGGLLRESGVSIAFVDVNEAWQNWTTNTEPTPDDVNAYVIEPLLEAYGRDALDLRSAPPEGEVAEAFDRWAGSRLIQKHGHRGHFTGDSTSPVRHARGIYYDEQGGVAIPQKRVGIESEPVGPGSSGLSLESPEALALLAAANFIGGFAHVFHSGYGVRHWLGTIEAQPGFDVVPRVRNVLPDDLHSAFNTITHGGLAQSPFTDAQGFPTENRVDSVLASDGRFVTLVYGDGGFSRIKANEDVQFTIYTPDTLDGYSFEIDKGTLLDITYMAGRILVGSYR